MTAPATAAEALRAGIAHLAGAGLSDAAGDARLLLAHALDLPRHRLSGALSAPMPAEAVRRFDAALRARAARQPVSQIIGRRAFWKHEFRVTRDTLDPRPETETLIEAALAEPFASVLDLGTGTGAILISLLAERPQARGTGTDISAAALSVAQENATKIGVCATFLESDWFATVTGRFDLIVSNPPYIALDEMAGLAPDVRDWEPGRRRPEMIIFSPAVAPDVRITWVGGSGKSNSWASRCRSVSVTSPASWAAVYTERFTLAPTQSR